MRKRPIQCKIEGTRKKTPPGVGNALGCAKRRRYLYITSFTISMGISEIGGMESSGTAVNFVSNTATESVMRSSDCGGAVFIKLAAIYTKTMKIPSTMMNTGMAIAQ